MVFTTNFETIKQIVRAFALNAGQNLRLFN